jgi:hypothetical protein
MPRTPSRGWNRALILTLATATSGAVLLPVVNASAAPVGATATLTAPVYKVVQEGLTVEGAAALAKNAGVGNALRPDGSFAFTDERFGRVPAKAISRGTDESGQATLSEAIDFDALAKITTVSDAEALRRARTILPVPKGYGAVASVDHTQVDQSDVRGNVIRSVNLDTTVSYQLTLGGVPVVGPGAKQRASFAGDGSVIQLSQAVRQVEASDQVDIISPERAQAACTQLYGVKVRQGTPVLGYYAPALSAERASGKGTTSALLPHYICQPTGQLSADSKYLGKTVAAAPSLAPTVAMKASGNGRTVSASAAVRGGSAPYSYSWASSSVALEDPKTAEITYSGQPRDPATAFTETLTVTVTDANGLTTTAHVDLPGLKGDASASGVQGGAGGTLATNGIEQTVDEWQCAQDSANGFKSVIQSKGHTVSFDFRGASAYEKDFKDKNQNGWDASYVDKVDAQWYTGHGWSGGFTFKGNHDDTSITPADARWGDDNLEWLQLESCEVLKDTNGAHDYFGRWGKAFQGLHLMNGFDTSAYCLNGGTGARFANYLFPEKFLWWTIRPALTVQQAWASMANDLEPGGVRWRSMSPATTGWVTNLGDHYWGQGSVGPDIRPGSATNPLIGYVSVSGVV